MTSRTTFIVLIILSAATTPASAFSTLSKSAFKITSEIHPERIRGHVVKPTTNPILQMSEDGSAEMMKNQMELAKSMSDDADIEEQQLKESAREKFAARRVGLVSDTLLFSTLIFCVIWSFAATPFSAISYLFGSTLGVAYSYGLGKYVETLGGSSYDADDSAGSGVGNARLAFLLLLFVVLGKFRGQYGLQELPAIAGFFTYQLASLSQGLKEFEE